MNTVTIIDFTKTPKDIKNLSELPKEIRNEIKSTLTIYSHGFQELVGQSKDRTLIWSAGGHWKKNKFVVENYGGKRWQWDGEFLRPTPSAQKAVYLCRKCGARYPPIQGYEDCVFQHCKCGHTAIKQGV